MGSENGVVNFMIASGVAYNAMGLQETPRETMAALLTIWLGMKLFQGWRRLRLTPGA